MSDSEDAFESADEGGDEKKELEPKKKETPPKSKAPEKTPPPAATGKQTIITNVFSVLLIVLFLKFTMF